MNLEIGQIPILYEASMNKQIISTSLAPSAIGPYSQAIRAGNLLFVSGQIPIDPDTSRLIEDKSIQGQTRRVIQNLIAIVTAAGGSADSIVKTTVYLRDMGEFAEMNAVYAEFFKLRPPARATVEAARLPRDVSIEIDCIASI
jgi:2-iminobutanoate/2-iminopropanoate deaminase